MGKNRTASTVQAPAAPAAPVATITTEEANMATIDAPTLPNSLQDTQDRDASVNRTEAAGPDLSEAKTIIQDTAKAAEAIRDEAMAILKNDLIETYNGSQDGRMARVGRAIIRTLGLTPGLKVPDLVRQAAVLANIDLDKATVNSHATYWNRCRRYAEALVGNAGLTCRGWMNGLAGKEAEKAEAAAKTRAASVQDGAPTATTEAAPTVVSIGFGPDRIMGALAALETILRNPDGYSADLLSDVSKRLFGLAVQAREAAKAAATHEAMANVIEATGTEATIEADLSAEAEVPTSDDLAEVASLV